MNESAKTQDEQTSTGQFIDPQYGTAFGVKVRFYDEPGKATIKISFTTPPVADGDKLPPAFTCVEQEINIGGNPKLTLFAPDGAVIYVLHDHADNPERWSGQQINAAMNKAWGCTNDELNPMVMAALNSVAPGVFMVLMMSQDPELTAKDRNFMFTTVGLEVTDLPEGAAVYGQRSDGTVDKVAEVVAETVGEPASPTQH